MCKKLLRDVWALGRCTGCSVCVAACSKGVLYWGEEQHPLLEKRQKSIGLTHIDLRTCEVCDQLCELSCPVLNAPTSLDSSALQSARSIGVSNSGDPNDVIRSLLITARSAELIDAVIIPDMDPWTLDPFPRIATTIDEIAGSVGMQFLWTPLLQALNEAIFDLGAKRLAIVGTPCVAAGVRQLMRTSSPRLAPYRNALRVVISFFCSGVYMPSMVQELIERGMGIPRSHIHSLKNSTARSEMLVTLWDGSLHSIPLEDVEGYTRNGCGSCHDFLGEQADISIGSVGADSDQATVITRTPIGENLLHNACNMGLLKTSEAVNEELIHAAQSSKDRRERAQALDEFQILMLDALKQPRLRADVRKKFVALYERPQGSSRSREKSDVSCSGC
jgi:coenzyme F420 hydrogenase subunit beta